MRPLGADGAAAGEDVLDRHLVELGRDRLGLVGAGGLDRLQVLGDGGVGAGLDHVRHPAGALHEAVAELAALVVAVPVEALGQGQALGRLEAEAVDLGEGEEQRGELLAALDDAELGGALDRVRGVEAGVGEADDLGARGLRLEEEGGEVGGGERVADGAEDLAAGGLDELLVCSSRE